MAEIDPLWLTPGRSALLREWLDLPATLAAPLRPALKTAQVTSGRPVLVIPGFLFGDASTSLLRRTITAAGMKAFPWRGGINTRIDAGTIDRLRQRLDEVHAQADGRKVTLVGWSLGGMFARSLANRYPDHIRMVVTLGSPFTGSPRANHAWQMIQWCNGGRSVEELGQLLDFQTKPPVHTVALWSRRDGIVAPLASRGSADQSDERIELTCTHMGFCASASGVRDVVAALVEREAIVP